MPNAAMRPCRAPGCAGLTRQKSGYCEAHERAARRAQDEERGSAASRGYGARWRRLRTMVLARRPLCADPFELHAGQVVAATDVDHVLPRADGGIDADENLQSLCHSCHSRKTAEQSLGWGMGIKELERSEQRPAAQPGARTGGLEVGG
jgi:5-methylcytosine-specific restriction protein A